MAVALSVVWAVSACARVVVMCLSCVCVRHCVTVNVVLSSGAGAVKHTRIEHSLCSYDEKKAR